MTIYSKRRGRRSLAAILAAMLVASVLAVVAGSPAQAANTSFEVKYDHDGNSSTAAVREFAGQDRYDTALRLAMNFARSKGGLGSVPTAVLSSGETLVDSISVAGLAGYLDAPILLTPTGSLHNQVADFIEDYGVSAVYVLGGTAAISDATLEAIEALQSKPTVTRVSGADRYATAAAIAGMISADSSWCGTTAKSAVLINGATDMMSYGVASQTVAYRLQLPVLMTAAGMLPDATADFIDANDIEHVQIIGGTAAVSDDVKAELTSLGVDTVARVDGDSAAAVSAELAKLAANGCGDSLGLVSNDHVALVRGNPDGVVAAPVLASSLARGYLVSPLIVTDSLPASVRDYLAATPKTIGTDKLNLGIVAVGGTAAVSQATMDAALEAAASSGALSVAIGATTKASDPVRPQKVAAAEGENPATPMFSLYFSDDVSVDLARLRDIIEVNGAAASVTAATADTGTTCNMRKINITLGQPLAAGDVISVTESTAKFGTGKDQRTVGSASATVTAEAPDRTRPTISIVGIAMADGTERQAFDVSWADNKALAANTGLTGGANGELTVVAGSGGAAVEKSDITVTAAGTTGASVGIGRNLVRGDRLVIAPGAIADAAGNMSAGTSGTAIKAEASPRITSVRMSSLKHSAHASWTVPTSLVGDGSATGVSATGAGITIAAKPDGDAAGAAGNDWNMSFDRAGNYDPAKPLDIDVRVDTRGKRVTVRFNSGPSTATLGDLIAEMNASEAFAARFSAGFTDCGAAGTNNAARQRLDLQTNVRNVAAGFNDSGRTQFAIEVGFSAYVNVVNNDELLVDVLAATAQRSGLTWTGVTATDWGVVNVEATGGADAAAAGVLTIRDDLSAETPSLTNQVGAATPPTRSIRYEFEASQVKYLPQARDLVDTVAGAQLLDDDPNTTDEAETGFRPAVGAVADGYARDDNSSTALARIDQRHNGAGKQRIVVSSSVKAPS